MPIDFIKPIVAVLLAVGLGYGSAIWIIEGGATGGKVTLGPWTTLHVPDTVEPGPYARARRIAPGLFKAVPKEIVTFVAENDADGSPLTSKCGYQVVSKKPKARTWSLTVYNSDAQLSEAINRRYSTNPDAIQTATDGGFIVHLSRTNSGANWLQSPESEEFILTFRLYGPEFDVTPQTDAGELPRIVRGAC